MTKEQQKEYGTEVIAFGDWVVTSEGLFWSKGKPTGVFIDKDALNFPRTDGSHKLYDNLLELSGKTWLNELDVHQLNTAYFFALDHLNCTRLFDARTLFHQRKILEERGGFDDTESEEVIM
jgi:hypothetical protein